MSVQRPRYRRNPPYTIGRLGRKTTDQETGLPTYERFITVQNGIRKDSRDRGSVDVDYGRPQNPGRAQPGPLG